MLAQRYFFNYQNADCETAAEAVFTDGFVAETLKADGARTTDCATLDTVAQNLACFDSFATADNIDDNTLLQTWVDCVRKCYGAGSKLLLTLTFVSMLMAFVAL